MSKVAPGVSTRGGRPRALKRPAWRSRSDSYDTPLFKRRPSTGPVFGDASTSFQDEVVDPIQPQPSQNPEERISFGSNTNPYAPKASLESFGSTPTPNGPVPSSPALLLSSTEPSGASLPPILARPASDTTFTSEQPSYANFEYAGFTSNSVPVVVQPRPLHFGPTLAPMTQSQSHPTLLPSAPLQELQSQLAVLRPLPSPPLLWESVPHSQPPPPYLNFDAPAVPFSPPRRFATTPYAPDLADERSLEPFSKSSPLCLDGKISGQSKYVVASGGYADIWTGSFGNKTVAIKVMRPFSAHGSHIEISKILKRSWREYLAWSMLHHPNILECLGFSYDLSPQTGQPSLVSPWMSNGTAIDYIKKRPNVDRVGIVVDIARGLTYLHNMNSAIVHGDLRAGNVLISDSGTACLSDFGLSKILSDGRGMTTSSELAGSLRWMAPELLRGSSLSLESDVWAYGMTILEILTGTRPSSEIVFDVLILEQVSKAMLPTRPKDVHVITDDVWALCRKCWQFLPEKRPSIKEVLADIDGVRGGERLP